jgi:hypothetical protein
MVHDLRGAEMNLRRPVPNDGANGVGDNVTAIRCAQVIFPQQRLEKRSRAEPAIQAPSGRIDVIPPHDLTLAPAGQGEQPPCRWIPSKLALLA